MTQRPKLLFVSPRFLFPTDEGGKIRSANILRGLKGGAFEIHLASPAPADAARFSAEIAAACDRFIGWPRRPPALLDRLLALPGRLPVGVATDRSAAGRLAIAAALAEAPAVVVADFPHAAVLLPEALPGAGVLFTHNVEAEIFERHARLANGPRKLVWADQARKMARFEGEACRRFGTVIAVSGRDARALEARFGLQGVAPIDTGIDLEFFAEQPPPPPAPPDGGVIGFTGVMDSPANIDATQFLMREVWPLVASARPAARAVVVGRNPPAAMLAEARARNLPFDFTGTVDDIRPHVAAAHLVVIPIRAGSGTRIKAFEAMAMGRPVVATRIGIEGLDITPGEHFLEADDAQPFAASVLRLLADPALAARLVRAGRARLEARFSWRQVAAQFEAICQAAMARRG